MELAQRIVKAFDSPLSVVSESFPLTASAGVSRPRGATAARRRS